MKDGGLAREDEAPVEQAKAILSLNWTEEYTQLGPRLYPHQWPGTRPSWRSPTPTTTADAPKNS
jgi:hypothetical protein